MTGVRIGEVAHVFDAFMSPGSVTERIHFYAAPYDSAALSATSGGLEEEGEEIELVQWGIDEAVRAIGREIVDAKTIMLLQWSVLSGPFAAAPA